MRHSVLRSGFLLAALLAAAPFPAMAGEKEEKAKAAAAEAAFRSAYAAASADPKARSKAVELLRDAPDSLKVSLILDGVLPRDDAPAVQRSATVVLRTVKDPSCVKELLDQAQKKSPWSIRGVVVDALGGIEDPAALAGLRKLAKDADPMAAASAIFALAERHPPEALEEVKKALVHSQWQVRLAALEFLARLEDITTVPLLCDRLEEEDGRLKQEVVEALKAVTGRDYKDDALKWRAYAAGGVEAAEKAGAGAPDPAAAGGGRAVATGAAPVEPTYYGEKVVSDKVVFVVDFSLSMNEEMIIDRETIVRETGAVVTGSEEEAKAKGAPKEGEVVPIEWWKIRTRMDFARSQLKYVISTLKRDQYFDVIWYSDSVVAWQGGLVPAKPGVKLKAIQWLDEQKCEGATNIWGGLTKALNLVGKGTQDENYSRGADTIYFMSDGAPSVGDIKDPDAIVDAIERIHKVRRVKIHVAQIGTSKMPFMQKLAAVTGGNYRFFKAGEPKKKE